MFRKTHRLCLEQTGHQPAIPDSPSAPELLPAHVKAVVDVALTRLDEVKARLGVTAKATQPATGAHQPSDCLNSIARANRQLNLLLEQPFSPSDVYQLLTLAAAYTARLLGKFPDVKRPSLPVFERG